jgi:predicted ATPase/class 3 adenylate cyclase/DNA-binding CsgD family transcriptional regulator
MMAGSGEGSGVRDEPTERAGAVGARSELVGTRTFLLTDVVGSTAMWAAEAASAASAIARHYDLIDACVAAAGGKRPLEQGEGDSSVAVFERAADAVAAAIAVQRALRAERWDGPPVEVRIGIHTGDAELRDGTSWVGMALNRCARIRGLGHGGQILLSSVTAGIVGDGLPDGAGLRDLGVVHLRGLPRPERIHQLVHADLPSDFPPISGERASSAVPTPLTSFVGREAVLGELVEALATERCVTLTGAGGSGKTRLACEVARVLAARDEPGAVHWVDLASLADPALLALEVAQAIGVTTPPTVDVVEATAAHLGDGSALLVLDSCEHVIDATASVVEGLLGRCPALHVLTTSREALGVAGERSWQVPPLRVPDPEADAEQVLASEAGRLFAERAATARRGFVLGAANATAVAAICRRLDGIPLALELAAARTRSLSPHEIVAGLDDRFALLTGGPRSALARQRTLEASVAWSHDLLSDPERILFRRLAVFSGGFTLAAVEVVGASAELPELAILDVLSHLIDRSLVVVREDGPVTRYELLETIRDFARRRLAEAGEAVSVRDRHLDHYLEVAEVAAPQLEGDDAFTVAEGLLWDLDNFRAAMDWSVEAARVDEARRLLSALNPFMFHYNLLAEFRQRMPVVRALEGGTAHSRLLTYSAALAGHVLTFDPIGGRADVEEGIALAREVGDPRLLARVLMWSGWMLALHGSAEARPTFEEVVATAEEQDVLSLGLALVGLSFLEVFEADLHAADAHLRRAEALYAGRRCPIDGFPATMFFRTMEAVGRADVPTAQAAAGALEQWVEAMPRNWFKPLGALARACARYASGDLSGARSHLAVSMRSATQLDNPLQYVLATTYLGQMLVAEGSLDEARETAVTAMALYSAVEGAQPSVPALAALARIAIERGETDEARRRVDELHRAGAAPDGGYARAWASRLEARLATSAGQPGEAEGHLHDALEVLHRGGVRYDVLAVLEALAVLAASEGAVETATRVLAAVDTARTELGVPRWPIDEADRERALELARAALSDRFDAVTQQGAAMTLEDVVAYVRRARGERGRPSQGWGSLTPTERAVVDLVTEGLTNPQIAERLFVSRGTVRTHLSHVFRKLGVATRAELAARAARRGDL